MGYEIIEQKEILHEGYAELLAILHRKADREGLSLDSGTLLGETYTEAKRIYGHLLGSCYSTQDDIDMLKNDLIRLRKVIERGA